jgi:mannitol/fructose-specific phosphotransferase system IIA component (Ntr-type)
VLTSFFGPNSVRIHSEPITFESAVAGAVDLLVQDGRAQADYQAQVLASLASLGPYFVVAPGIALAHAAPSEAVIEPGFALLKLEQGAISGSGNDPVQLVFAFCSPNNSAHIEMLGSFANWISNPGQVNLLLNASAESVIRSYLPS